MHKEDMRLVHESVTEEEIAQDYFPLDRYSGSKADTGRAC